MDDPKLTTPDGGEMKLADFDLDAWIDGTTGITGVARIVQRGDLLAKRDRLAADLETARKIPADQRGLTDRDPRTIEAELEQCYAELWNSMLWVHVQGRTDGRRADMVKRLKGEGVDLDDIGYHLMADAIVKVETADGRVVPLGEDGFGAERLITIRDRAGDAALIDLSRVFREVTATAPAVRAPLSREPSSTRGGGTSQPVSGQRKRGGSRRS